MFKHYQQYLDVNEYCIHYKYFMQKQFYFTRILNTPLLQTHIKRRERCIVLDCNFF